MVATLHLRLETYAKLSNEDRASLDKLAGAPVRTVAARRDLVREGDSSRSVFLVLKGWGSRYKSLPDGRRQILAFLLPGDLCDCHSPVLQEMDHSIGAITPLKVAEFGADELERTLTERPRIAQALRRDELISLSVQREWTLNVGQRTAYERIAHLLCELFLRLDVVGLTQGRSCDFPLTQLDLADATGLTAVHVNRTLQELRKDGLIELHSRSLTIFDLASLQSAGLFNPAYLHLGRGGSHLNEVA